MTSPQTSATSNPAVQPATEESIRFADSYQTSVNAGTYTITATLTAPDALKEADLAASIIKSVQVHISGPRYSLSPDEIHAVFPPENGSGDYNNVLPHVVLNRPTLPWERLIDRKLNKPEKDKTEAEKQREDNLEQIPFLALLLFTEAEELDRAVTPPQTMSLAELGYDLEPGEKSTDQATVIQVKADLLTYLLPMGNELRLLAHGRELFQRADDQSSSNQGTNNQSADPQIDPSQTVEGGCPRAVVIASRLPASDQRHIAHLVMLENRYTDKDTPQDWKFKPDGDIVRLVCLKSWQFNCAGNKPTLKGRLLDPNLTLDPAFTVDWLCVPEAKTGADTFEKLRRMGYAALPYHLRSGDRAYTLYHGPLVPPAAAQIAAANAPESLKADQPAPVSAENLTRLLKIPTPELGNQHIFDVSLAAAWQLGQLLMLRDQTVAMAYFTWRRHDAQRRAKANLWQQDGHLHLGDNALIGLEPMPAVVQDWFQQCLALHNIPFKNLVPDDRMVPENSLRMFSIHTSWMKSFLAGALSLGRSSDADRLLEAAYRKTIFTADPQARSGFLIRSPVVDEHLDLQVNAFIIAPSNPEKWIGVNTIRLDRLGSGLLLGIYASSFSKLRFYLPPIGLLFGFEEKRINDFVSFSKKNKNSPLNTNLDIPLKSRPSTLTQSGDVVDIAALGTIIASQIDGPFPISSGHFAYHLCEGTESVIFDFG